jgi:putative Holliday junction resolvase
MKVLALDIGDQWTGTAISDPLGFMARPYQTVTTRELIDFLHTTFSKEKIDTVVVGHPVTMKGTSSDQTKKVELFKAELEQLFPTMKWIFWDERLSSKRAESHKHAKDKEAKMKAHSIAAAFFLDTYLLYRQSIKNEIDS